MSLEPTRPGAASCRPEDGFLSGSCPSRPGPGRPILSPDVGRMSHRRRVAERRPWSYDSASFRHREDLDGVHFKRILVGKPLASSEQDHQALGKPTALAVFASDAISSTAYATEEILFVLLAAVGFPQTHKYLMPMAIVAVILLAIVSTSYRQTIFAYPDGGGAYVVSRENISQTAALVAGASLLVDYTLTVAVSVSSGVLAIGSAFHFNDNTTAARRAGPRSSWRLHGARQPARAEGVGADLRRPDLRLHACCSACSSRYGIYRIGFQRPRHDPGERGARQRVRPGAGRRPWPPSPARSALFILLRAFSSGAVVLAGVEAMSNGVPAVPQARVEERRRHPDHDGDASSACSTLGVSYLAPPPPPGVRGGRRHRAVADGRGRSSAASTSSTTRLQFATFAILILAANTAYADFPQLSSNIARDGFLPRQLANRGDRLVFSNGVLILSGMAGVLIVAFRRRRQRPDPALRGRRVHGLHAVPVRHVPPPPHAARAGLAARPGHQRRRLRDDRHRARSSSSSRSSPRAPGSRWS